MAATTQGDTATQALLDRLSRQCRAIPWEADPETGRFLRVGALARDLLGYSPDRWIRDPDFWAAHIHPEDRDETLDWRATASSHGGTDAAVYRMIAANGRIVWFEDRQERIELEDGSVRLVGIMRDITERQRLREDAESARLDYFQVLELMHDALVMEDPDGDVVACNRRFPDYFGLTYEEALNARLEEYMAPEHGNEWRRRREARMAGKPVPRSFEFQVLHPDGSRLWLEAHTTRLVEDGYFVGTQSVLVDVTHRRQADRAIKETDRCLRLLLQRARCA